MPTFVTDFGPNQKVRSNHVKQILNAWTGQANSGVPFNLITVDSDVSYAATIKNMGEGGAFRVLDTAGVAIIDATDDGVVISLADGVESGPGITMGGDADTGFYRIAADRWGFSIGGTKAIDFQSSVIAITPPLTVTGLVTANAGATLGGNLTYSPASFSILSDSPDGTDNSEFSLAAGAAAVHTRGAFISAYGNEHANTGILVLSAGDVAGGTINFITGGGATKMQLDRLGNLGLGVTPPATASSSQVQFHLGVASSLGVPKSAGGSTVFLISNGFRNDSGQFISNDNVSSTLLTLTGGVFRVSFAAATAAGNAQTYTDVFGITNAGEVTMPLQPAFLAFNSVTDANQVGAGATVTVDFDTEIFDVGGDFSGDTFTAPVAGKYRFSVSLGLENLTAAMTSHIMHLVTSNRNYTFSRNFTPTAGLVETHTLHVIADMDAGDTAHVTIQLGNGAGNTASISGHATLVRTYFSGELVS